MANYLLILRKSLKYPVLATSSKATEYFLNFLITKFLIKFTVRRTMTFGFSWKIQAKYLPTPTKKSH